MTSTHSGNMAWLANHAEESEFADWNQGQGNAPWNAETFTSIPALKASARSAGSHFFDPATMRFFNSKIETGILGQRFFITSEFMDDPAEKRYTIRWAYRTPAGNLEFADLVFQDFETLREAKAGVLILQGICADVMGEQSKGPAVYAKHPGMRSPITHATWEPANQEKA